MVRKKAVRTKTHHVTHTGGDTFLLVQKVTEGPENLLDRTIYLQINVEDLKKLCDSAVRVSKQLGMF